ncbi:hypothetical protein [Chromobacterium paludis]|uniref:Carboxypeptidase regulatory-like domain-containing protein n=1 Tax=Chromobacterium paludis TaxID=2605945 RepID=A0A5C1DFE0_9NEIS|nr:hypothetical protein [Chromobacterium paludis]QEL55514.1 hypothetical protein FYK34_08010 [Chromobacterium paludis]
MAVIIEIKTITSNLTRPGSGIGGPGSISGSIKSDGSGLRAVLYLLAKPLTPVARTISDESGKYAFNNLDMSMRYMVISSDPAGQKNAVIADNITPEMPK